MIQDGCVPQAKPSPPARGEETRGGPAGRPAGVRCREARQPLQGGGCTQDCCLQKWQTPYLRSQWVQCGVRCPPAQRSVGILLAARQSFLQKLPVNLPQSTQGLQSMSPSPQHVTVMRAEVWVSYADNHSSRPDECKETMLEPGCNPTRMYQEKGRGGGRHNGGVHGAFARHQNICCTCSICQIE